MRTRSPVKAPVRASSWNSTSRFPIDREMLVATMFWSLSTRPINEPARYSDVYEMINKAQIDVVAVATMQYWHALLMIWACQANNECRPAPRSGQCLGARDPPRRVPAAGRRVIVGTDRSNSTEGELHESPPV